MEIIHNIRKSALTALLCAALAPLPALAQAEGTVSEYSIEVLWTSPNYLHDTGLSKAAYRSDFFVHDDVMYINYMYFGASELHMVDARTGVTIGDTDIEWNVDHSATASSFVGTDSAGHPYLASLSTSEFDGYPLELYPLTFDDGRPTVNSLYTLPLSGRVWPRDPVAVGDISSGSFTVVATAWCGQEPISWIDGEAVYEGALLLWRVVDGMAAMPALIRAKFSDCTLLPCGDDSFL
ncbi:MAG: hypothetical protein K2M55_09460, partial [Muribaculaceae bacterium]|nr:hypothetical protein [Muribaculaceae bacterium]